MTQHTFHVETLTRHLPIGEDYATTFCGGAILDTLPTWDAALDAAHAAAEQHLIVYATERQPGDGSSAPLVRHQVIRASDAKRAR